MGVYKTGVEFIDENGAVQVYAYEKDIVPSGEDLNEGL